MVVAKWQFLSKLSHAVFMADFSIFLIPFGTDFTPISLACIRTGCTEFHAIHHIDEARFKLSRKVHQLKRVFNVTLSKISHPLTANATLAVIQSIDLYAQNIHSFIFYSKNKWKFQQSMPWQQTRTF